MYCVVIALFPLHFSVIEKALSDKMQNNFFLTLMLLPHLDTFCQRNNFQTREMGPSE